MSQLATLVPLFVPLFVRLELTHFFCEVCGVLGGFLGGWILGVAGQDVLNSLPVGFDWLGVHIYCLEGFPLLSRPLPGMSSSTTAFAVGGSRSPPGKLNLQSFTKLTLSFQLQLD